MRCVHDLPTVYERHTKPKRNQFVISCTEQGLSVGRCRLIFGLVIIILMFVGYSQVPYTRLVVPPSLSMVTACFTETSRGTVEVRQNDIKVLWKG